MSNQPTFHPSLADLFMEQQRRMTALRSGSALREAADEILTQLPGGPLTLWGTSSEGSALAATCAALRSTPTRWRQVSLLASPEVEAGERIVVVEPVEGGAAWHQAIERACPSALVVTPERTPLAAAA